MKRKRKAEHIVDDTRARAWTKVKGRIFLARDVISTNVVDSVWVQVWDQIREPVEAEVARS